jgi:hypothetical protein
MEMDFRNSAEVEIFSELLFTFAEFHIIPRNSKRKNPRDSGKILHGIPEKMPVLHRNQFMIG